MSQVIFAQVAIRDPERLRDFLRPKNPAAAEMAEKATIQVVLALRELSCIGYPVDDMPEDHRDRLVATAIAAMTPGPFRQGPSRQG